MACRQTWAAGTGGHQCRHYYKQLTCRNDEDGDLNQQQRGLEGHLQQHKGRTQYAANQPDGQQEDEQQRLALEEEQGQERDQDQEQKQGASDCKVNLFPLRLVAFAQVFPPPALPTRSASGLGRLGTS